MESSKAILLVDDEGILLLALKQALRQRFGVSYRYETSYNGQEALASIRKLEADGVDVVLVITDWLMPGMKGDELLTQVHQLYPPIKLMMLSGHALEADLLAMKKDFNLVAFLRKPWDNQKLFQVIEGALAPAESSPGSAEEESR